MTTPLTREQWLEECGELAKVYEDAMTGNKISDRYLDKWLKDRGLQFKKEEQTDMPQWMRQQLRKELGL